MREITLYNFRCYESKSMSFRPGINLLIGDNSVGKTSLLRACNLVINAFFSGYSDTNTVWKSADDDDFREIKNEEVAIDEQPIKISFLLDEHDCPDITMLNGMTESLRVHKSNQYPVLTIEKRSRKNSRNLTTGLKPLKRYASLLQKNSYSMNGNGLVQHNALPLFAYFTTEDIHTIRKFDKEKKNFKQYPQKPSFGYFESYDCKGLLDCWIKRLLVLKEANKGDSEIECVRKAIVRALGPDGCGIIQDIAIRVNEQEVYFMYCDGREVRSDLLSDGYRRIVSIVMDLAFRCALLNKVKFGDEAYRQTHGTVIIDEIDEHLHPELQVRILKALHDTFPKLQFIVSTHAPLVMSSVEPSAENVVYKLEFEHGEYTHKELNTYGLDASTIMDVYMGKVSRDVQVAEDFKKLFGLIDAEDYTAARTLLEALQNKLANGDPELARAEAMISFMED